MAADGEVALLAQVARVRAGDRFLLLSVWGAARGRGPRTG